MGYFGPTRMYHHNRVWHYAQAGMINRGSIIVRPNQSYMDWAAQLDDSGIFPDTEGECTIYLIPEFDDEVEAMEILAKCFDIIFEAELYDWHTDESAWPKNRTFAMFREWFNFKFHSVVEDLCDYELVDDEFT